MGNSAENRGSTQGSLNVRTARSLQCAKELRTPTEDRDIAEYDNNYFLPIITSIIQSYLNGDYRKKRSEISRSFNEDTLLRKKWVNSVITQHFEVLPAFAYTQQFLLPQYTIPSYLTIYQFLKGLTEELEIQYECLIMMLIYTERLRKKNIQFTPENWRPLTFTGVLISNKIFEDNCAYNIDFTDVCELYSLRTANSLERHYADTIAWELHITPEEYSKFYFQLKHMATQHRARSFHSV